MSALATEKLNPTERSEWNKHLSFIKKNAEIVFGFAEAIIAIKKGRLYREKYKTYEAFVEEEIGLGRRRVDQLITALENMKRLEASQKNAASKGKSGTTVPLSVPVAQVITAERQLRELTNVPDDKLAEVVDKAIAIADNGIPTAADLRQAKAEVLPAPVTVLAKLKASSDDGGYSVVPADFFIPKDIGDCVADELEMHPIPGRESVQRNDPMDSLRALLLRIDPVDAMEVVLDQAGGPVEAAELLREHFPQLVLLLQNGAIFTPAADDKDSNVLGTIETGDDPVELSTGLFERCNKDQRKAVFNNIKTLWDKSQKPASPFSEAFEEFWEAFPARRKSGKTAAAKCWDTAVSGLRKLVWKRDVSIEEFLVTRATEYAKSDVGKSEFVKGPCPWLHQGCWDDPAEAWNSGTGTVESPKHVYPTAGKVKPGIDKRTLELAAKLPPLRDDE